MKKLNRREAIKLGIFGATMAGSLTVPLPSEAKRKETMTHDYDVLIVGGGPAGLSAALSIGRMSLRALVCDDARPRNAPSAHLNNFPTRDGIHPGDWKKAAREDIKGYKTIAFFNGNVSSITQVEKGFKAKFSDGSSGSFKRVILADGIKDRFPAIPGFEELWGKSIFHCPYCHGYEIRGQKLGLLFNSDVGLHLVPMLYQLSTDLMIFTNGKDFLQEEQKELLVRKGIKVIGDEISDLRYNGPSLDSIILKTGESIKRDGLFSSPLLPFQVKSGLGDSLGCQKLESGLYKVTERNETSVKGVFAAGDNMSMMHSVLTACAAGSLAGGGAVHSILSEEFES